MSCCSTFCDITKCARIQEGHLFSSIYPIVDNVTSAIRAVAVDLDFYHWLCWLLPPLCAPSKDSESMSDNENNGPVSAVEVITMAFQ